MKSLTIEQYSKLLNKIPMELNISASRGLVVASKSGVGTVRYQMRMAATTNGSFPLIASAKMYKGIAAKIINTNPRVARRVVVEVGSYQDYSEAMEMGAGPHTPPIERLREWAAHKVAQVEGKRNAGKERGEKANSKANGPGKGKATSGGKTGSGNNKVNKLAYLVQQKIKKVGIKPRFFMLKSVPGISKHVGKRLRIELRVFDKEFGTKTMVRAVGS
jgi:hypothetical protein